MVSDVFDKEENRMNFIQDAFKTLTKREENVLRLYFGIGVERRVTLEEIGQDFDLTVNTIKKYKNKGIRKMMHPTRSKSLISHIDKDLIERCINERKSKLLDEFMVKLLKIDWEEWVLK